jgi:hypothetical protein
MLLTKLNYFFTAFVIILDIADVEAPGCGATSAKGISKS